MRELDNLHVRVWGEGEPIVLVHGSNTADPGVIWARQRSLAERYQLLIPDRRGYGASPPVAQKSFDVDVRDIVALLGAGAHLVGLSYGGVLALLAASRRPELVRSLTVIEPPALDVGRGHLAVDQLLGRMAPLYNAAPHSTPERFIAGFVRALGQEVDEPVLLSAPHRRAIQTTMDEPPPWEAEIPLEQLAAATFPKLVISGDWHPALEAVADILALRLGAERAVVSGAGHGVQSTGKPFNDRLERLIAVAVYN